MQLTEGKLTLLSIFGLGVSLTTVNQVLQCAVLLLSLIAGVFAVIKHIKNNK